MSIRKIVIAVLTLITVSIGLWYLASWYFVPGEVLIKGVSYNGIYTGSILTGSGAASLRSVIQYWKQYDQTLPEPSLDSLDRELPFTKKITLDAVADVAESLGLETRTVRLGSPRSIARYLERERTPLIFFQRMKPDFQGTHFPFRVMLGVSMDRQVFTVHDTFLGPVYEIMFDDFAQNYPETWTKEQQSRFLEVRPSNYRTLLARTITPSVYENRSEYEKYIDIILGYILAQDANMSAQERGTRLIQLTVRPDYPQMPQRFRMSVATSIALYLSREGQHQEAKNYAEQAVALNKNLDRDAGVWRGLTLSQHPRPWVRLGDAKLGLGDRLGAIEAYQNALGIDPNDLAAQSGYKTASASVQ